MTFQLGEKLVYPNHGVATVVNISSRAFAGRFERYYLLHVPHDSLTVMVPFSHVNELRLRKLTRNGELARVLSFLAEGCCRRYQDWKDRFKENSVRMRDGSLLAVAEVLKSLLILQSRKPLCLREKKMLETARHISITELSTTRGLSEANAAALLEQALAKASVVRKNSDRSSHHGIVTSRNV